MIMTQIELRYQIRTYLKENKSLHYLRHIDKYSCHTTLGYDIYELAATPETAVSRLINRIVGSKNLTEYFVRQCLK